MPLVSVVMPSYNHERFVSESIESVLGQDFDDFELIIVDDASTDSSRQIVQKYAAEDARIRVILHEENCGISKTMNEAIAAAKGKFNTGLASDDVWVKNKLTKQLTVLEQNEDLVVWSEGSIIDETGRPTGKSFTEVRDGGSKKKSGRIFDELLIRNYIFGSSVLYKKANLGAIRFDESLKYLNDYKFVLDLAAKYEFYYISEPLAQYRTHANNALGAMPVKIPQRRRTALQDQISVREEALREHYYEISDETRAIVFEKIALDHCALGQTKSAMLSFLRAAKCSPRSRYPQYPRFFLECAYLGLLSGFRM